MARAAAGVGDPAADYRLAAAAYGEAYERRASLKALLSLALATEHLGDKQRALGLYLQALALRPPHSTAWAVRERLAGLYLALGDRAEAERQARQALGEVPERDRPGLVERLRGSGLVPGA
jgi:tetratricopeptide (TPR) repeat protein